MILLALCNSCFQAFEVTLSVGDMELVRSLSTDGATVPCPRHCGGAINISPNALIESMMEKFKDPLHITGTELYQAVGGIGLPDEVPKDPEIVAALLKANRITKVSMEQIGPRIYLHELVLENGMTVHLSSGARGATVLKVTKRHG